ncbi:MAG: hypothetical protein ACJAU4_001456 [Glaciecola sp.]|jgi:hypothetical protein
MDEELAIFTFLNENIDFITIEIDSPPKVMQHTIALGSS